MLVGDILLSAREAVPDLPGTLPAPGISDLTFTPVQVAGGNFTGGGRVYYLVFTYSTPWGETAPSPEIPITMTGIVNAIQVVTASSPYVDVISGINFYTGNIPGGECVRTAFTVVPLTHPVLVITNSQSTITVNTPPQGNSAFLPDSGGPVASASQLFRWLSDALHALAAANGGIPDAAGFPTIVGRQNYTVAGDWKSIDGAWYDGYPINLGSSQTVFRHNAMNGTVAQISYTQVADTLVCELYPQPVRTAGVTALSGPIAAMDLIAPWAGAGGFVLPLGLAMLGTPPNYEVVSYAGTNGGLQQLVRGMGGTNAQAWPVNTPIYELNCMITGLRAAQTYSVGQASNTIRLPSEWTPYIHLYLLARYRTIEQQQQEADGLMKQFDAYLKATSRRKPILGNRQIQPSDEIGLDVRVGLSRTFGGIIIP